VTCYDKTVHWQKNIPNTLEARKLTLVKNGLQTSKDFVLQIGFPFLSLHGDQI